jgi:hypothetical protein
MGGDQLPNQLNIGTRQLATAIGKFDRHGRQPKGSDPGTQPYYFIFSAPLWR